MSLNEDFVLTSNRVQAWRVGSGPMPWWVVDQEPCGPNAGKNYVAVRTDNGDVNAKMDEWIVRGITRRLLVVSDADFALYFSARPKPSSDRMAVGE